MSFISSRNQPAVPVKTDTPILVQVYLGAGVLSVLGGLGGIAWGIVSLNITFILSGIGGLGFSFVLFGLAEFFAQVARIADASEETARLLREKP